MVNEKTGQTMSQKEIDNLWQNTLEVVRVSVSAATFSTWFNNTFLIRVKEGSGEHQTVEIGCSSSYILDTLEKRYFGLIQDSLEQLTGKPCSVVFTVKQNPKIALKNQIFSPLFEHTEREEEIFQTRLARASLPRGFTFENFAVSGSNQFAWAAAQAIAKNPGRAYNPFVVWGGVGVGKTHLVCATVHQIIQKSPNSKVIYCTGEEFMVEIIDAIKTRTTSEFKKRYRQVDVLIVDDIQFIAGKPTAQEEFFHTFNVIHKEGGQIIMTSDKPPSETKLEDRLKSRFEAGLVADIGQPDFELLCAILLIKAREREIVLPMECVEIIANTISSPRALEGFVIRLKSHSALTNTPITLDYIQKLLGTSHPTNGEVKQISPQELLLCVCEYFSLSKKTLLSPTRNKTVALPRQILMYLMRTELKLNLKDIGSMLGGRDHTTIIHGVDKISTLTGENKEIEGYIMGIKKQLWG